MSQTIAIVQPYEHMSVAEQKFVLAEYATHASVIIQRFIGEDEVLNRDTPLYDDLVASVTSGEIDCILVLDGIAGNLPRGFCEDCRTLGSELRVIGNRKAILVAS